MVVLIVLCLGVKIFSVVGALCMSFFPPRFLEWESFSDCAFS